MLGLVMDVRTWVERQRQAHTARDRETAAQCAALGPAARAELQRSLSLSLMKVVLALPEVQRERTLKTRAPLPESSVRALARLRALHARADSRG
jgi:hypothetical protein